MASPNVLRSDLFLSQVERVRREIATKFQRSHQVLVKREATLLSELDELVVRYRGEGVNQQIEELNRLKESQLSSVKENENKEIVNKSVSVLEERVRDMRAKFERDLASMRRVVLKWDECVFDKLSEIGSIDVSDLTPYEYKGEPLMVACKHSLSYSTSPGVFYYPTSIALDSETFVIQGTIVYKCLLRIWNLYLISKRRWIGQLVSASTIVKSMLRTT